MESGDCSAETRSVSHTRAVELKGEHFVTRPRTLRGLLASCSVVCLAAFLPLTTGQVLPRSESTTLPLAIASSPGKSDQRGAGATAAGRLSEGFDRLPLAFEPAWSQSQTRWSFLARGNGYALYLAPAEAVLAFHGRAKPTAALRLNLMGANADSKFDPLDEMPGKTNYLLGNSP